MTTIIDPECDVTVREPGVYDLSPEAYHGDPVPGGSLSSTGARKLLPPSCPALYRHWRDSEEGETKRAWDIGHAAHRLVLGAGPELVEVVDEWGKNPNDWRTDKVKALVKAARERGAVPLHPAEMQQVQAMAERLRAHPWASRLFQPGTGQPERTIVWQDRQTGVWCRALLDWLPDPVEGRYIFRDYKTAVTSAVERPERTVDDLGYYIQAAFHLAGLRALGRAGDDAQALIVLQCKEPPYLVRVVQPDPTAMRIGAAQVREAIGRYAECRAAEARGIEDAWPAWSDAVELISLPPWTENQFKELW